MEDGLKRGIDRLLDDFGQFHDVVPSPEKWINNASHGKYGKYFTDNPQKYLNNFKGILNGSIINRIIDTYYPTEHFSLRQYMQLPTNQNKPPYKNKTLQDYITIQTHKQGGNMKIKQNNETKLISRHQTGGLIPKGQYGLLSTRGGYIVQDKAGKNGYNTTYRADRDMTINGEKIPKGASFKIVKGYNNQTTVIVNNNKRQQALANSRMVDAKPNTYFINAVDMPLHSRVKGTLLGAHTCINTATGFYDSNRTFGKTKSFTEGQHPRYSEIPANEAQPGDIVIFTNKDGKANHAAMMDGISTTERFSGYPVDGYPQGYPVHVGDTLLNYSNGGRKPQDYRHSAPMSLYNAGEELAGDDFSGPRHWFRYVGPNTVVQPKSNIVEYSETVPHLKR